MTSEIISAGALVLVAVIEALAAVERREDKKRRDSAARHAERRAEESRLAMQMMDASLELGMATAIAVEEGKLNGEMKAAKKKAKWAQEEYEKFIQALAAHQVVKL